MRFCAIFCGLSIARTGAFGWGMSNHAFSIVAGPSLWKMARGFSNLRAIDRPTILERCDCCFAQHLHIAAILFLLSLSKIDDPEICVAAESIPFRASDPAIIHALSTFRTPTVCLSPSAPHWELIDTALELHRKRTSASAYSLSREQTNLKLAPCPPKDFIGSARLSS